jgi:hypothetical protein
MLRVIDSQALLKLIPIGISSLSLAAVTASSTNPVVVTDRAM